MWCMKNVFLSGPIRGISREESLGWRNLAKTLLEQNFNVQHALRGREESETLPDPRLAIIRDKNDIDTSDIVLVNDTNPTASMIGTSMEIMYAYEKGKVVLVFGKAHEKDYWLNYHIHAVFENLEEACAAINTIFK